LIAAYRQQGDVGKADILEDKLKRINSNKSTKSRLRVKRPKKVVV